MSGTGPLRIGAGPTLAELRATAAAEVDAAAEAARLRFITPGAGQALEYAKTEAEARLYRAAGYPTPFDAAAQAAHAHVWAEIRAREAAGQLPLPDQAAKDAAAEAVADEIIAEADAWIAASGAIKEQRRAAKLAIQAATSPAAIRAVLAGLAWPAP